MSKKVSIGGTSLKKAPQSALTSVSIGGTSAVPRDNEDAVAQNNVGKCLRAKKRRRQSTSSTSAVAQNNEDAVAQNNEDPSGKEGPDKHNNITRCLAHYIESLAKRLDDRYKIMINSKGLGAPLKLQLTKAPTAPLVRNVAELIDEQGMLKFNNGRSINLYDLAPCVIGDPNEGDYVRPSLGVPVDCVELAASLKEYRSGKLRNMYLANLRDKLIQISDKNDPQEDDHFMYYYSVLMMSLINAPRTALEANLNYLGTFCTGKKYKLCEYSVDVLVEGITDWKNKKTDTIIGNILLPIILVADFAKLEGDDSNPPVRGYPRYEYITEERLDRLSTANWNTLEFREFVDSVYAEPYHPLSGSDVLGAGSSQGSSPQPRKLSSPLDQHDFDGRFCQAAKATELVSKLHAADALFFDSFLDFMGKVAPCLEGAAKDEANRVKMTLCSVGKKDICPGSPNYCEALSTAFKYISDHQDICSTFSGELNKYMSHIKEIDREIGGDDESCGCCFSYPSSEKTIDISCEDLKSLEDGAWLRDGVLGMYILHLQGSFILPELKNSGIHNKYYIMDPLYHERIWDPKLGLAKARGKFRSDAERWKLKDMPFILWPMIRDSHWSLAIMCKEDGKRARILHMDSSNLHDSKQVCEILQEYMKTVLQIDDVGDPEKIEVPQQENCHDCGLFVLYNIKRFIMDYTASFQFGPKWYSPEEAPALRTTIKDLIQANKMKGFPEGKCSIAEKWASSVIN